MKAVIFDMDGVIIDSQLIADRLLNLTAKRFGVRLTKQELHNLHGVSSQTFWKYVKDTYNLPRTVDYYHKQYDVEEEICMYNDLHPIQGIPELITDLRGHNIPLALATSASKRRMQAVLDLFAMHSSFDVTICADDVIQAKPNPEIFINAADKLQILPKECIVIEDALKGLEAAIRANMKCVLYWKKKQSTYGLKKPNLVTDDFMKINYAVLSSL